MSKKMSEGVLEYNGLITHDLMNNLSNILINTLRHCVESRKRF